MGKQIYHMTWDFQDEKWQIMRWEDEFTTWHGTSKMKSNRYWDGKTILPQEMGCPRWEVTDNKMGRRIYHMTWDFQNEKLQVMEWRDAFTTRHGKWRLMRWEDEFTTGNGKSKMGSDNLWDGKTNLSQEMWCPRCEVAGNEMGRRIYHKRWDVQDGKWQVMRWENVFITGNGMSKMGSDR